MVDITKSCIKFDVIELLGEVTTDAIGKPVESINSFVITQMKNKLDTIFYNKVFKDRTLSYEIIMDGGRVSFSALDLFTSAFFDGWIINLRIIPLDFTIHNRRYYWKNSQPIMDLQVVNDFKINS